MFFVKHALVFLFLPGVWAQGVATRNATPTVRAKLSGKPFRATFTDVARESGLVAKFVSGGERQKKYIVEANGSGVAMVDIDNDGDLDIFLVNGSRLEGSAETSHLYRNELKETGKAAFTDVTKASGTGFAGWGNGVCAGDVDNDGLTDLFVTYWGPNRYYRNLGGGKFEEIAAKSGIAGPKDEWSTGCTFLDYDRDGKLDLFVSSYQKFDLATAPPPGKSSNCEWKGMPVFCGPRGLPFGRATLFHNRGDGTFEDVSKAGGIAAAQGFYAFTAVAADLNGDGWTDIYVASDSTPNLFFRNNKDGTFSEIATEAGLAYSEHGFEQGGMGVAVGDIDGDGRLDLLKTNFAGDYPNVYRNQGGGIFEDVVVKTGLAVNPQVVGWGIGLADVDNDGLPDVVQVNGHVYPELEAPGTRPGGEQYRQPRLVYRNLDNGRLEDVSARAGAAISARWSSRGAAFGDYDNDGDIDAIVMNMNGVSTLLRNELKGGGNWLSVELNGTRSNRSAIGAVVNIAGQTQAVLSQASFLSQNDFRLHFGLGEAKSVDRITVRWPSGESEEFPGSAANRAVKLVEGSGSR